MPLTEVKLDRMALRAIGRFGATSFLVALPISCTPGQPAPASVRATSVERPAPIPAKEGAFFTGKYRNLFAELGTPERQVKARLEEAYAQLFHGDPANQAVMFLGEDGAAYIKDIGNDDVRSEGMSYGMMIAVQMNQKEDFDALWKWARTHMYHADPKHPTYGYFSWQMRPDGTALDEMPAPDGEEYFATALLFASHRWGDGEGIFDYQAQAKTLLDHLKNRKPITGVISGKGEKTGVALFHPEHKMVRFTPDTANFEINGDHTNPSYHLPAFYELWARWGAEADRPFWAEAAQVSRDYFSKVTHPTTGLTPDYADFDGKPVAASWNPSSADFQYDSWRTGMNWAVDFAWFAKDERELELSDRLLGFFASHGRSYPNLYAIDGTPRSQSSSLGLSAANAVVALASTKPLAWNFVEDLYRRGVPTGKWRYYDGMLYMMAMLHVSGHFRVYSPQQPSPDATH